MRLLQRRYVSKQVAASSGRRDHTYHSGVFFLVWSRHDFDAAVGGYNKLLLVECDRLALSWRFRWLTVLLGRNTSLVRDELEIETSGWKFVFSR